MTNRKRVLFHFGAICGLVGKESAEIKAHPGTALAKRVDYHVARLGKDWKKIISGELTRGEKRALSFGKAKGKGERKELTATTMESVKEMLMRVAEEAMQNPPPVEENEIPHLSTSINFTAEECEGMAEEFKHEFERNQRTARLIKYNFGYEIRYRRNGFNVSVLSDDLATAKQLFIAEVSA